MEDPLQKALQRCGIRGHDAKNLSLTFCSLLKEIGINARFTGLVEVPEGSSVRDVVYALCQNAYVDKSICALLEALMVSVSKLGPIETINVEFTDDSGSESEEETSLKRRRRVIVDSDSDEND